MPPDAGFSSAEDQTLDVDLSFLAGSSYSIIAVAARYGDRWPNNNYFIGTGYVNNDLPYGALHVGWYDDSTFRFSEFDDGYVDCPLTPDPNGTWQLQLSAVTFSVSSGKAVYLDGVLVGSNFDTRPLASADQGGIGRGFLASSNSTALQGGIAEILVFKEALSNADRQQIESYLRLKWDLQ